MTNGVSLPLSAPPQKNPTLLENKGEKSTGKEHIIDYDYGRHSRGREDK